MPSKWAFLRGKLEKFTQDVDWQSAINIMKQALVQAPDGCRPGKEFFQALQHPEDGNSQAELLRCPHGQAYQPLTKLELCQELDDEDLRKEQLEAELKQINTKLEALNQLLLDKLEVEGDALIRNSFGSFFIQDEPYTSVVDKQVYLAWVKEQGLEDLLNVPWQSTNSQVKSRLETGGDIPPGLKVFIKSTVRRRRS